MTACCCGMQMPLLRPPLAGRGGAPAAACPPGQPQVPAQRSAAPAACCGAWPSSSGEVAPAAAQLLHKELQRQQQHRPLHRMSLRCCCCRHPCRRCASSRASGRWRPCLTAPAWLTAMESQAGRTAAAQALRGQRQRSWITLCQLMPGLCLRRLAVEVLAASAERMEGTCCLLAPQAQTQTPAAVAATVRRW
jgi:hypothetical protein